MTTKLELAKLEYKKQLDETNKQELKNIKLHEKNIAIQDKKIKKFNEYIQTQLKDCIDKNVRTLNDTSYGNIIAFSVGNKHEEFNKYYVRIEFEQWEDRMSDDSPLQICSRSVLGLYGDGWSAHIYVSCNLPGKYYDYLNDTETKVKIDKFISDVYAFFCKRKFEI
jgi:ABC-type oligopeptide transport system substrate-binding subunit